MNATRLTDRLLYRLTEPHSVQLRTRHELELKEFLKLYENGFFLRDLTSLRKVLATLLDRGNKVNQYYCAAKSLLSIFAKKSIWKETVQDELQYESSMTDFLSFLGNSLINAEYFLQQDILKAILGCICTEQREQSVIVDPNQDLVVFKPITANFMETCIEKSTLSKQLIQYINQYDCDLESILDVLFILHHYSQHSAKICKQIIESDGVKILLILTNISRFDGTYRLKFWSLEILFNLLDNHKKETLEELCNIDCLRLLRNTFFNVLNESTSEKKKQIRNDCLIIFRMLFDLQLYGSVKQLGIEKEFAFLATFPEVKHRYALFGQLKLQDTPEDYEFRQILILLLLTMGKDQRYLKDLRGAKAMDSLMTHLALIETPPAVPYKTTCPLSYRQTLQMLGLQALEYFVVLFIDEFCKLDGLAKLKKRLQWCLKSDVVTQVYYDYNREVYLRWIIRILMKIVSTQNKMVLERCSQLSLLRILKEILLLTYDVTAHSSSIDSVLEIQTNCFFIIAAICDENADNQDVFGENNGEMILINFLKKLLKPETFHLALHNTLQAAVINCIWCTIVGNRSLEQKFFDKKGGHAMLDISCVSEPALQGQILACISDFWENKDLIEPLVEWQVPNYSCSLPEYICRLWREEEQRMGASRSSDGVVTDVDNALVGKFQKSIQLYRTRSGYLTPAILDVSENFRVNLYSLFQAMRQLGGTLLNDIIELPFREMVTIVLIENFLELKFGEVWAEFMSQLQNDKIKPEFSEEDLYNLVYDNTMNYSDSTIKFQQQFLKMQNKQYKEEEQLHYEAILTKSTESADVPSKSKYYCTKLSDYSILTAIRELNDLQMSFAREQNILRVLRQAGQSFYLLNRKLSRR